MNHILTLTLTLLLTLPALAQTTDYVSITYDDAGNRIRRITYILKVAPPEKNEPATTATEESEATFVQGNAVQSPQEPATEKEAEENTIHHPGGVHSFKLYPNPTTGKVEVLAEDGFAERTHKRVAVFDMNGKVLQDREITNQRFNIDLSVYTAGSYIIKLTAKGYRNEFVVVKE